LKKNFEGKAQSERAPISFQKILRINISRLKKCEADAQRQSQDGEMGWSGTMLVQEQGIGRF
jgi:hypothetical protein